MVFPTPTKAIFFVFLFALFVYPLYADEEKKADATVKESSATIEKNEGSAEAQKTDQDKEGKAVKKGTETTTNNEVGDLKVYNYGIQAIFINSNVTVNGGTISGEMTKTESPSESEKTEESRPSNPPSESSGKPAGETKDEKPGKFDELIKDATKEVGLFTVYTKKDEKIFWEIKPEQLDKNILFSGILSTGLGEGWIKPGAYLGGLIVQFHKIDDKIQIMQRNLRFVAPEGSPEKSAMTKNYQDSIVASFPVEATNPANAGMVIELGKFFLSDVFNLTPDINSSLGGAFGYDRGNSYIKETKVLPENVVVRSLYAYRSAGLGGSLSVPSPGSAQLEIIMDVRPLKDNPNFKSRQADPRLGHFLEAHLDFSDKERSSLFVRNISKWDIRKASPELVVSPPTQPIVVWIENTVPKKYRDAIRNGLLEWNKAFEKVGIKNALEVKEQPDDAKWDISDARYNTIHWNESYDSAYSGVAQWVADPRSGEILHGSFLLEAESIRGLLNLNRYLEPDRVAMVKRHLNPEPLKAGQRFFENDFQESMDQAVLGRTILAARAGIGNASQESHDELVNQYLFWVVCHEFGHVLGLRHNFEASTFLPLEDLHNKALTKKTGLYASVMEYPPMNIAPEGTQQGYYYSPTLGPYDYLAIEYAYKEIKPATGETEESILNAIAEKAESPQYVYGTDEDLYGGSPYFGPGLDPYCNQFDLGNEPLAFAKQQTQLILDTLPKLPKLIQDGDTYLMVRNAFNRLLGYYFDSAQFALKYIGGQYVNRVKKGGKYDRFPLEPVSAVRQREALNFLTETIFSDRLFQIDPELLNSLASEKWYHWGTSFPGNSSEYPLSTVIQNLYDTVLYAVYSPVVIHRIVDAEKQRPAVEVNFTVPELFRRLKQGIWSEVYNGFALSESTVFTDKHPFVSTYRRILQREHLKLIIEIMLEPPMNMPDDARTQAWRTLVDLEQQIDKLLKKFAPGLGLDDYSRDHLSESLQKIRRALDARVSAQVDLW